MTRVGLFLTLEGPEGCGKTTQAALLVEFLRQQGRDVLTTREPGGTPIGDQVRTVLMSLGNKEMNPRTEFLLFSASRAQLVAEVIRPHLDVGGVVVSDRFYDSSFAYQGYGHGLSLDMLRAVTAFVTDGLTPDLTLLLDVPVEEGLSRRREGGQWNRLDAYELAFHKRAREGYLELAAAEPDRWVTIDARRPVDAVQAEIRRMISARLERASTRE